MSFLPLNANIINTAANASKRQAVSTARKENQDNVVVEGSSPILKDCHLFNNIRLLIKKN